MKLKIFIRTILITVISLTINNICLSKPKEIPYMRDGISFSVAEGWKIIANDSISDNAYYFSAERTGSKATGLFTITWANKVEDPQKTITALQLRMKEANMYRNPGIEFSETISDYFAGIKAGAAIMQQLSKVKKLMALSIVLIPP